MEHLSGEIILGGCWAEQSQTFALSCFQQIVKNWSLLHASLWSESPCVKDNGVFVLSDGET